MNPEVPITLLGMERFRDIELAARDRAAILVEQCAPLSACKVTIERLRPADPGNSLYAVRIDALAPGRSLTVSRVGRDGDVAMRKAFEDMASCVRASAPGAACSA